MRVALLFDHVREPFADVVLASARKSLQADPTLDITGFYVQPAISSSFPHFGLFPLKHLYGHSCDILLFFNPSVAKFAHKMRQAKRKIHLLHEPTWATRIHYEPPKMIEEFQEVYQNPSIEIVAANKALAEFFTRMWGKESSYLRGPLGGFLQELLQ